MQHSTTWILKSLWGACERWNKSDCIDLSAAFAYTLYNHFFYSFNLSFNSILVSGKQEGLDQEIIAVAAQILPPSVVELVETTLFKLIDQGFGAGILGAMFLFLQQEMHIYLQRGADRLWEDELPSKKFILLGESKLREFSETGLKLFNSILYRFLNGIRSN